MTGNHITEEIRRLAHGWHGVVSRRQLLEAGIHGRTIDGRVVNGWLLPISRGVFAVGRPVSTETSALAAAILAAGPEASLSRRSAAAHLGLMRWAGPVEVLRPKSRSPKRFRMGPPGLGGWRMVEVRRSESLPEQDLEVRLGIPITSVSRTLMDLAGVLERKTLRSVFSEADRDGLLRIEEMRSALDRGRGRKGIGHLRSLVEERDPRFKRTRSELEVLFLELCRSESIPVPLVNHVVSGFEVDCFWPDRGLVVELDGFEFHRGRMAMIRDGARDNELQASGYRVVRFTYDAVVNHPDQVVKVLEVELARAISAVLSRE